MSPDETALAIAGAVFVWQTWQILDPICQVTISGYEQYNMDAHRRIER